PAPAYSGQVPGVGVRHSVPKNAGVEPESESGAGAPGAAASHKARSAHASRNFEPVLSPEKFGTASQSDGGRKAGWRDAHLRLPTRERAPTESSRPILKRIANALGVHVTELLE